MRKNLTGHTWPNGHLHMPIIKLWLWKMLINFLKSPIPQWRKECMEEWSEICIRDRIVLLIGRPNRNIKFQWNRLTTFALIPHTDRQNDRTNGRQTDLIKTNKRAVFLWQQSFMFYMTQENEFDRWFVIKVLILEEVEQFSQTLLTPDCRWLSDTRLRWHWINGVLDIRTASIWEVELYRASVWWNCW